MKKGMPQWDYALCVACGICTEICPTECIGLTRAGIGQYITKLYPDLINRKDCTSCGLCEKACPIQAVVLG